MFSFLKNTNTNTNNNTNTNTNTNTNNIAATTTNSTDKGTLAILQNKLPAEEEKNNLSVQPFEFGVTKYKSTFTPNTLRQYMPSSLRANVKSAELNVLSYEYDAGFRALENCNFFFIAIGAIGAATAAAGVTVATGGAAIIPILILVAFAPTIGRCAQLFPAQWYKNSELQYICSACLSMVTNMQEDLIKLKKFYQIVTNLESSNIDIKKKLAYHNFDEYKQPVGLYAPVERNLYKFMFLLLDAIDFNNSKEELGALQYSFIIGLFKYCDFENPRYIIQAGTPELTPELTPEEKTSRATGEFKFRYTYQNCRFNPNSTHTTGKDEGFRDYNIKQKIYNDVNYAKSCNNYNDVIVRMLDDKFLKARPILQKIVEMFDAGKLKIPNATPNIIDNIKTFLTKNNKSLTDKSSSSQSRFSKKVTSTLIGSPTQKYREMLREYVIMTGNWSMIISKYSVQYNEFILLVGEDTYKNALLAIDEKLFDKERKLNENIVDVQNDNAKTIASLNIEPDKTAENSAISSQTANGGRPKTKRQYKRKNKTKKQIKQVYRKKTLVGRIG